MVARPPRPRLLTRRAVLRRLRSLQRHVTAERRGYALLLATAVAIGWAPSTNT